MNATCSGDWLRIGRDDFTFWRCFGDGSYFRVRYGSLPSECKRCGRPIDARRLRTPRTRRRDEVLIPDLGWVDGPKMPTGDHHS